MEVRVSSVNSSITSILPPSPEKENWFWWRCLLQRALFLLLFSCWVVSDSMDYSLPDSSVHGISQARILEWVAVSFSRGSSWHGLNPCLLQVDSLPLCYLGSPEVGSAPPHSRENLDIGSPVCLWQAGLLDKLDSFGQMCWLKLCRNEVEWPSRKATRPIV